MGDIGKIATVAALSIGGIAILGGCGYAGYSYFKTDTIDVVVTGAEDHNDMYLAFTLDGEGEPHVFRNEDAWYRLKFDSSDFQAELEGLEDTGTTVTISKYGWRVRLFSMYENIVDIERAD